MKAHLKPAGKMKAETLWRLKAETEKTLGPGRAADRGLVGAVGLGADGGLLAAVGLGAEEETLEGVGLGVGGSTEGLSRVETEAWAGSLAGAMSWVWPDSRAAAEAWAGAKAGAEAWAKAWACTDARAKACAWAEAGAEAWAVAWAGATRELLPFSSSIEALSSFSTLASRNQGLKTVCYKN